MQMSCPPEITTIFSAAVCSMQHIVCSGLHSIVCNHERLRDGEREDDGDDGDKRGEAGARWRPITVAGVRGQPAQRDQEGQRPQAARIFGET